MSKVGQEALVEDQEKQEKLAKLVNLMMASESENEALQCWRSARAMVPLGRLMDHVETDVIPTFGGFRIGAAFADRMRQATEKADLKLQVAANRARSEELKLRDRELKLKEREEALLHARQEREAQESMPRAAREQAALIAGIERLSASNPAWADRRIARELRISPSTVAKYRNALPSRDLPQV